MRTDDVSAMLHEVAEELVRPRFRALTSDEVIEKRPNDLVTVADREAEAELTRRLLAAHPGAVVVGEEAAFARAGIVGALAGAEHAWVIDPVDGTRNFVHGSTDHAMMLAELRAGAVVRSWILQPELGRLYVAERGAGVWCNQTRIEPVERRAPYSGVGSRSRFIGKSGPGVRAIRPAAWCCGVDYPRVLSGAQDFIVYTHGKPWDHLPGLLMLQEVGGDVREKSGRPIPAGLAGPGILVVANEDVWRAVAPLWRDLGAR